MEDEERQKKLEAGKAKLAEYRQRKAHADGQRKQKKKKRKGAEDSAEREEQGRDELEQDHSVGEEVTRGRPDAPTSEVTFARTLRSGETVKHDQTYTIEPESEVSTTAEDYTSEEEELRQSEAHSEHGLRDSPRSQLQIMEEELAAKSQIVEELSRELEEIRAAFGSDGVQQLQDFEAALNQRDGIITQLTANLQQARKEKDEVMREFLELTEQSQKLKIQFQQLQAGETLRSSSHSSTAVDLLQARQQVALFQQQLEERETQLRAHLVQIDQLQHTLDNTEMVRRGEEESFTKRLQEKDVLIAEKEQLITEHEHSFAQLNEEVVASKQQLVDLNRELALRTQELESSQGELSASRQKERMSSGEILQLMGTVEDLQRRYHQGSQSEGEVIQRMEVETARKMEQLRAELDEMYGQQIVQMKQELRAQHSAEVDRIAHQHSTDMERVVEQHRLELDRLRGQSMQSAGEVNALNAKLIELQQKLQEVQVLREKAKQELAQNQVEKINLQKQVKNLLQDLQSAREWAKALAQGANSKGGLQAEAQQLHDTINDLRARLAEAEEANNELELKHDSEITNYKIKLEMLEREKDAVLDRMAESQEAELERLRTQLLFSHEEELTRLREDLQRESQLNVENLRDELDIRHREALEKLGNGYEDKLQSIEGEKNILATERMTLLQEIVTLKNDLNQALERPGAETLVGQLKELQMEIELLRQTESERVTIKNNYDEMLLKNKLLLQEMKEKEENWVNKMKVLESDNKALKESNLVMKAEKNSQLEEKEAMREKMETLFSENQQIHKQVVVLQEEIERQKNTYSFAEKNFEVNYQELREEYKCLVKAKAQLEERILKDSLENEVKLSSLQSQLQKLQETTSKLPRDHQENKMEDDQVDGKGLIEKHTIELTEKLGKSEREKEDLALRLSEVMEKVTVMEAEVERLAADLKQAREERREVLACNKDLEQQLGSQTQRRLQRDKKATQPSSTISSSTTEERQVLHTRALEEEVQELRRTLRGAEREREEAKEKHAVLAQENRALQARLHSSGSLGDAPVEQTTAPPLHQPASGKQQRGGRRGGRRGGKRGGSGKEAPCAAEHPGSQGMLHRQRLSGNDSSHTHEKQRQESGGEKKEQTPQGGGGDDAGAPPVTPQEDMEGRGHEECRLQLEAQRISLSQIHAAQLELQRENLLAQAQAQAQLRPLQERPAPAQAQDPRPPDAKEVSRTTRCQGLIEVVSEEHRLLIQSFAKVLGEENMEALRFGEGFQWEGHVLQKRDTAELSSLLQEARELCGNLHHLKEAIVTSHGRLLKLQSTLRTDGNKMEALQMAYEELKQRSEGEIASLRSQIDRSHATTQDANASQEQARAAFAGSEGTKAGLEAQFQARIQQQQAHLEQTHSMELQRLRTYYQQQAQETEQRYTTEILLLQGKLQELTGAEAPFSLPSVTQLSVHREYMGEEATLDEGEGEGEAEDVSWAAGRSAGLRQQVQAVQRTLLHRHQQEVAALTEQHRAQLERLRAERSSQEPGSPERGGGAGGGAGGGESSPWPPAPQVSLSQILEQQHQERVEEEIAKVIVQMSVEFAQHTELARITKQARETTSAMQTHPEPPPSTGPYGSQGPTREEALEEVKRRYEEEKEKLERELRERTQELLLLRGEVQRETQSGAPQADELSSDAPLATRSQTESSGTGTSPAQRPGGPKGNAKREAEMEGRRERGGEAERRDSEGEQRRLPSMQSSGTQTEERGEEGMEVGQKEVRKGTAPKLRLTSEPSPHSQDASPDAIATERNLLRSANERLRQVLCDVLKTTAAAEETIGRHVEGILEASSRGRQEPHEAQWQRSAAEAYKNLSGVPGGPGADLSKDSCHGSETAAAADDTSVWSGTTETDEGLEVSQRLADLESEECLMGISTRLQSAVEKLLHTITETSIQVEHAKATQTELMRESFRHNQEISELLRRQEELQEQLAEEGRAREQLALELHRAEGLIDGYSGERATRDEQLRQKVELQQQLEQELQVTSSRLQELEQERLHMQQERELLARQQDAMKEKAGLRELRLVDAAVAAAPEADLLEETEKLMKEKVEAQRQSEKENTELQKQVKLLEGELEEQMGRAVELEQAHRAETADLTQQIQALEKQLENNRKFLDEQAVDREHERDVFQQEIQKLEQQLKNPQKLQPSNEQRHTEVEELRRQLQEKADWCSELQLATEQQQRDVRERDEELERLGSRVRELEQALLSTADAPRAVEEHRQHAPMSVREDTTLEAQLQTEREALDRKEKEICNLEEQLEQFREELENKSEEVQQLHMQLEIQRKELSTQQEDLEAKAHLLQVLEEKDRELAVLNEQIAKLRPSEAPPDNQTVEQRDELLRELELQLECMRGEQERLKRNSEEEVDQLNAVIEKLQQELAHIEHRQPEEFLSSHEEETTVSREEYDEMKQKMDQVTQELDTLKAERGSLPDKHGTAREERATSLAASLVASSAREGGDGLAAGLEEALTEKTAAVVVMQAQVHALEQSASTRVADLSRRVEELEVCVEEKDSELQACRLRVEQAQADAHALHHKVSELEEKLREKVAAMLVSQAQLGAVQAQTKELQGAATAGGGKHAPAASMDVGVPRFRTEGRDVRSGTAPAGKVGLLTEKLKDLEEGLSGMQKDQELQKQLLSSSEEEVLEYERRLAVLMDLLNQMRTKPAAHRTIFSAQTTEGQRAGSSTPIQAPGGGAASMSELLQKLQDLQDEAAATKEELNSHKEHSVKLQDELQVKDATIAKLQTRPDLQKASVSGDEEGSGAVAALRQELKHIQDEAAASKEELRNNKEHSHKLQSELQIKDTTIAKLQADLKRASIGHGKEDSAAVAVLRQELQDVQDEAAASKEELRNYRESCNKLKDELQAREMTIALLKDQLHKAPGGDAASLSELLQELQEVRDEAAATKEELSSYRERSDKLQDELQDREQCISQLQAELQQLREALSRSAEEQPPSQPKRKGSKHSDNKQEPLGKAKAGSSKDKPSLSRKNSSLQSEKSSSSSSTSSASVNGASSVTRADVATQVDLGPSGGPSSDASEEVAVVIGEYTERIEQMQELHAAEIMDMEARHISESESLRREAQELEEECKALKAVIDKLRGEGVRSEHPAASQFKDGYTSDSSSDWSQRTGQELASLQPELRTTPEGARRDNEPDPLPDKIKTLLREVHQEGMQVLSLSELPVTESDHAATQLHPHNWGKERDALLATVESLKALITKLQTHRETQGGDWRGDLVGAVQQVFARERDVLKAALYSQLDLLDTSDAVIHLNQLERTLSQQDARYRQAMGELHTADRNSLLAEIRQLRATLGHLQTDPSVQDPTPLQQHHQVASTGLVDPGAAEERRVGAAGSRAQDQSGSHADRLMLGELKGELAQTKLELETTLKAQHKHLKELDALRTEVAQKVAEVDKLNDKLAAEQKSFRELQWSFEKQKSKSEKKQESEREELEDLKLAHEEQQALVAQLSASLGQEQESSALLQQQLDGERNRQHSLISELQVQLESQRARAQELSSALERERELHAQLRQKQAGSSPAQQPAAPTAAGIQQAEAGCSLVEEEVSSLEALLQTLQQQLDEKHTQVVRLVEEAELHKLEAVQAQRDWQEEKAALTRGATQDQNALREARANLARLEGRVQELQAQVEREREKVGRLERERDRLQERVTQLTEREGGAEGSQQADKQSQTAWQGESQPVDRTRDWVLQQKVGEGLIMGSSTPSMQEHLGVTQTAPSGPKHMDNVISRLKLIASKIKNMTSTASDRLSVEGPDREGLVWIQSNMEDVVSMLQQVPVVPPTPESAALVAGGSSVLTERLLRQNAELTGFVSRLTEEKNDLRNQLLKLEEEVRRLRQRGLGSDTWSRKGSDKQEVVLFSSEREAWGRERLRLEKALRQAEAELTRLRGEMRADALRDMSGPDADNATLRRIYGKYLRSESFRKALIYQKKYLLLLLGGFQECEEATLALIARMGGRPSNTALGSLGHQRRGFTRFRSAVRVSIALTRMRFLVRRWQRAAGATPLISPSVTRNGVGQITGGEGRVESPYLQPGSVEIYGERRGTTRGRSGRDSPRSAHSVQHRFHGMAGDSGGVSCPHLQNYDPDRALTDYISRLEALQRRLGSVQSGSSSYAQLHFGIRR